MSFDDFNTLRGSAMSAQHFLVYREAALKESARDRKKDGQDWFARTKRGLDILRTYADDNGFAH
jgi:hypothetical protein